MRNGADDVMLSSLARKNRELVYLIINRFGSQSVVDSLDYKLENSVGSVYDWERKTILQDLELDSYLEYLIKSDLERFLLNSVDNDGTGFGLDYINKHKEYF